MNETLSHTINPKHDFKHLKCELLNQNPDFYTFDFKTVINRVTETNAISVDDFWKCAKIKAKKATLFVDEILSCNAIESAPLGFIREISMSGKDVTQVSDSNVIYIKERVVIDEKTKTILFFQLKTSGDVLLFALNHVSKENNHVYFSGHYVYSVDKDSNNPQDKEFITGSNKTLPPRFDAMILKMKKLTKSDEFNHIYQELYS